MVSGGDAGEVCHFPLEGLPEFGSKSKVPSKAWEPRERLPGATLLVDSIIAVGAKENVHWPFPQLNLIE